MRLYPRVSTSIPVSVTTKGLNAEGMIANLSMAGALLRSAALPVGGTERRTVVVRYRIPGSEIMEHGGAVVRTGERCYGLRFEGLSPELQHTLWKYVADHSADRGDCPYCGEPAGAERRTCGRCGWALTFAAADYRSYHERKVLATLLQAGAERLSTDRLRRLVNFMDAELFKTDGNEGRDHQFVGTSSAMLGVFANIRKVAPTDVPVLIVGESGTGKELTALAIHERSTRRDKPFITINCAAIPEGLLEAELFGFERGAFTGAYTGKRGKFEHADGGTIFLDEVGDMPLGLQAKLLRFLQDNIVERIGGLNGKKVDVRLIAATNRDLAAAISEGAFRGDLYYRLDALTISLPPLRERGADKLILARHFLAKFCKESGAQRTFSPEVSDTVMDYAWPGNVREMINKVRRALIMAEGESIAPEDLGIGLRPAAEAVSAAGEGRPFRERIEIGKIEEALKRCENNISKAARMLGISRTSIYNYKRRECL